MEWRMVRVICFAAMALLAVAPASSQPAAAPSLEGLWVAAERYGSFLALPLRLVR